MRDGPCTPKSRTTYIEPTHGQAGGRNGTGLTGKTRGVAVDEYLVPSR